MVELTKHIQENGIVQIFNKDIKNGKKIKVMNMNTLDDIDDRFQDFDFDKDAQEDHNDSLQ